jgi:hypothetical protein
MTSRSLALLTALSSPVLGAAAVVGWITGAWPATPLTFMVSAAAMLGGPLLAILHVATADDEREAPTRALPSAPPRERRKRRVALDAVTVTPRLAAARQFHAWRDSDNAAIARREHEELLLRNQRLARRLRSTRAL